MLWILQIKTLNRVVSVLVPLWRTSGGADVGTVNVILLCYTLLEGEIAKPDVEALCLVLEGVSKRWHELGSRAGLTSQDLALIDSDLKDKNSQDCLVELVKRWLQRSAVTWKDVVELLDAVGEVEKAQALATDKGMSVFATQPCISLWFI